MSDDHKHHHEGLVTHAAVGEVRDQGLIKRGLLRGVKFYRNVLSPLKMGPTCRFEPSCSAYALEALQRHGTFKAMILVIVRLAKCGPWHPGGIDPVPIPRKPRRGSSGGSLPGSR